MSHRRIVLVALSTLCAGSAALAEIEMPSAKPTVGEPEAVFARLRDRLATSPLAFDTTFTARSKSLGTMRGSSQFVIGRPNRLKVSITDGNRSFKIFSNGDTMTIYDPKARRFARMPARSTPGQAYGVLVGLMSVEARILDFVSLLENITAGDRNIKITAVGSGTVKGSDCERFKVTETWRTETKTWDVWLAKAEPRLPCKFVAHSSDTRSPSWQTNEFKWRPQPVVAADEFVFTPPAGAKEVTASQLDLHPPMDSWR